MVLTKEDLYSREEVGSDLIDAKAIAQNFAQDTGISYHKCSSKTG